MVGMRDVAKKAGVSLSTVSLVINNGEHVSDDVRSRVERTSAQSLKKSHQYGRRNHADTSASVFCDIVCFIADCA